MGARGVVGVKRGVPREAGSTGSELRRTERSVALRVWGLAVEMAESEPVGEGFGALEREVRSRCIRDGRGLVWVTGELRTASRTGSKAGIGGEVEDDSGGCRRRAITEERTSMQTRTDARTGTRTRTRKKARTETGRVGRGQTKTSSSAQTQSLSAWPLTDARAHANIYWRPSCRSRGEVAERRQCSTPAACITLA